MSEMTDDELAMDARVEASYAVSVIETARALMAKTRASGVLLRHEPYPMVGSWEGPAQWRIGVDVWEALRRETLDMTGDEELDETLPARLFGYPIVVDECAVPGFMVLEPRP